MDESDEIDSTTDLFVYVLYKIIAFSLSLISEISVDFSDKVSFSTTSASHDFYYLPCHII